MTLEQAKELRSGDYIHTPNQFNADGTPMRCKVTSIKTWKTRPDQIEVRYKRGMYEYGTVEQWDLENFELGYGS